MLQDVTIRGELIIKKQTFQNKYSNSFSNQRNFVSGIANSKKLSKKLKIWQNLEFIAYEVIKPVMKPSNQMNYLVEHWGKNKTVKFEVVNKLNKEVLSDYLMNWRESYAYEIDGIIVTQDGYILVNQKILNMRLRLKWYYLTK